LQSYTWLTSQSVKGLEWATAATEVAIQQTNLMDGQNEANKYVKGDPTQSIDISCSNGGILSQTWHTTNFATPFQNLKILTNFGIERPIYPQL